MIESLNDNITRSGALFDDTQPIWGEQRTTTTQTILTNSLFYCMRIGDTKILPTLPTGVTAYIPQNVSVAITTVGSWLCGKLVYLGELNIGTNTFTDGNAMPTITELGVSRASHSAILCEVTTALDANAGSITVTYVDQDGNSAETTTAQAFVVSSVVGSVGLIVLNAGDVGVRDITSAARSSGTMTGVATFWGIIPFGFLTCNLSSQVSSKSFLANGFNIVRLGAGDRVGGFAFGATTTRALLGSITYIGED